jgi:RluA family pseudouridine synthase
MQFQSTDIPVLFCDEALLVIDKPAGLSTLPDGYDPSLPHIKRLLESQYSHLWIVHRLDKETSGVLCLARSASAHRALNTQFEQRRISKVYHALVIGNPDWHELTCDQPLRVNGDRRHRTVADDQAGQPALTHFNVMERFADYCLIEAVPETGRTHQIRAHLAGLGLCIIGDRLYCRPSEPQPSSSPTPVGQAGRMLLHALSLEIDHPLTGERLKFSAPYPDELTAVLQQLRSSA